MGEDKVKIDCRDLDCPKPVIETKKALEKLDDGKKLKVIVNSDIAVQNVLKLVSSLGYEVKKQKKDENIVLKIYKKTVCDVACDTNAKSEKVLFLKDDKVGKGELGKKLMLGFLGSFLEQDRLPSAIICVNKAVFLSTVNEPAIQLLTEFHKKGVKIYSCGACLEYFNLELKVGEVGNAYNITQTLVSSKGVISL